MQSPELKSPEMALVAAAKPRIVAEVPEFLQREEVQRECPGLRLHEAAVLAALDVAALQDVSPTPPAVLVAPSSVAIGADAAATAGVEGAPQAHDITLVVHTIVAAPNEVIPEGKTRDEAGWLLYAVRRALTNWTPDGWFERLQYAGGRLVSLDGACMEWADEFRGRVWFAYPDPDC